MATIDLSDVIKLIPDSKLNWSTGCNDDAEFDVESSLSKLLAEPVEFPSLDQAILKEDVICIPVEPGIPNVESIVQRSVFELCSIGISASNITVLLSEGTRSSVEQELVELLEEVGMGDAHVLVHDSTSKENIGFLGPSQAGDPITLNARLVHADFVLPIARFQVGGWKADSDFLYPYFSDVDSQKRFFKLSEKHRVALNEEVNKWLGSCFRIICSLRQGFSDGELTSLGSVLAGEPQAVTRQLKERFDQKLDRSYELPQCDLVIAQFSAFSCLTNEELNRVFTELADCCQGGGSIVVLMDDSVEIPRFADDASKNNDDEVDFNSVSVFVATSQKLTGIGLGRISDVQEVQRLIDQHDSVLVVADFINEHHLHSITKNLGI